MQCPKCSAQMEAVDVQGIKVDRCGACAGMWFDLREHEHLLKAKGQAVDELDIGDPLKAREQNEVRDIDCPRCHTPMVKLRHHEQRSVDYEQCATCGGVYLDAVEFEDLRDKSVAERMRRAFPKLFT